VITEDQTKQHSNLYQNWADRNGISHASLAILWVIAAFILFQFFGGLIAFLLVVIKTSAFSGGIDAQHIMSLTSRHIGLVFFGNSIGQILFLALATWAFCKVQVSPANRRSFLRLQTFDNTPKMIAVAFLLMIAIQPVVWFVGWLNTLIPLPQFMHSLQAHQMGVIKDYLQGKGHLWLVLLNIAVVPAFCEELLFRGYALRSFQKSWGVAAAIIVTGAIFGFFHLEPTNFFPLAGIGILLAYVTWITQSVYPAMVAHFVNNGTSILIAKYYPDTAMSSSTAVQMPPLGLLIAAIIISSFLVYLLFQNKMNPRRTEYHVE
jgi:membrane protease YdiL (CAAX protease family)